jgi:hypothetical protein
MRLRAKDSDTTEGPNRVIRAFAAALFWFGLGSDAGTRDPDAIDRMSRAGYVIVPPNHCVPLKVTVGGPFRDAPA